MGHDNEAAVAEIYQQTARPLIGLLTALGGSTADAEEIAQDAFVRLLEKWDHVRDYDDVNAWVRTVAVRMLISRQRRRKVATLGLRKLAGQRELPVEEVDPAQRIDLSRALAALPLSQRSVLLLHHVYDQAIADVAATLQLPEGTVKSRLARARRAIGPLLTSTDRTSS